MSGRSRKLRLPQTLSNPPLPKLSDILGSRKAKNSLLDLSDLHIGLSHLRSSMRRRAMKLACPPDVAVFFADWVWSYAGQIVDHGIVSFCDI
jgi:hypothetical protein